MSDTSHRPGSGQAIKQAAARYTDPEQQALARIAEILKRRPTLRDAAITMAHGAGGKASHVRSAASRVRRVTSSSDSLTVPIVRAREVSRITRFG